MSGQGRPLHAGNVKISWLLEVPGVMLGVPFLLLTLGKQRKVSRRPEMGVETRHEDNEANPLK